MAEETVDLIGQILDTITKNASEISDLFLTYFIMYRNLKTGANTITESGLTSPNSGQLQEWPAISPNGVNLSKGGPGGGTTPISTAPLPTSPGTQITTYKGFTIYQLSNGTFIALNTAKNIVSLPYYSVAQVQNWINANYPNGVS
jgi:hypothetical protein